MARLRFDDTEAIAVRIGQHDVIGARLIAPGDHAGSSECANPFDLGRLTGGIQIEVVPLMILGR